MNIEHARFLKRVCDDVGNQECDLREDYSGRGMYGRTTAGIVVDSVPLLLADVLQWVKESIGDTGDAHVKTMEWNGGEIPDFSDFRVDNMGRSTILY
jgi:hypothetical protein